MDAPDNHGESARRASPFSDFRATDNGEECPQLAMTRLWHGFEERSLVLAQAVLHKTVKRVTACRARTLVSLPGSAVPLALKLCPVTDHAA